MTETIVNGVPVIEAHNISGPITHTRLPSERDILASILATLERIEKNQMRQIRRGPV